MPDIPDGVEPATRVTPGAAYSKHYFYPEDAITERAVYIIPDDHDPDGDFYLITYFHGIGGVGGNEENFVQGTRNQSHREAIMDDGRFIVVASNGANKNAGNTAGNVAHRAAVDSIERNFNIIGYINYGQSMGELLALLTIVDPTWPDILGAYGISGVCNLEEFHAHNITYKTAVEEAYAPWAVPGTFDQTATAGHDPLHDYTGPDFADKFFRFSVSNGDTAVPRVSHSDAFRTMILPYAEEASFFEASGPHLSSAHYDVTDLMGFLYRCIGDITEPPENPTQQASKKAYIVIDGENYLITDSSVVINGNPIRIDNFTAAIFA